MRQGGTVRGLVAHLVRRAATPDGRAVVVLAVLPVLVFVGPALLGYPAVSGDDAIQNFPLRAFSGQLLRSGHLPLWNPFIWSGSPLLGGLNAGSLYPGTLLFAVMPAAAAWVANLLLVYWTGGLGLYALARQYGVRPLAALLGGLTYAFAGTMSSQIVHLGVVQGMGLMPLVVLAQLRLSWALLGTGPEGRPRPAGSPWPWLVLLSVLVGCIFLTGEPRSMAEAEVVAAVVFAWLVLRPYRGAVPVAARLRYAGATALAAVWGAALGAVQLLPGLRFIGSSQRASLGYAFFASGSLHPSWSVLMLVPDLFGGDGVLHQPTYFNSYNLPEVTGYVGLLPLAAFVALATVSLGRRRDPRSSDWGLWLALVVLGTLLAFGQYTWLGPVFGHIPFFDKVRLQSRNIGITDLALAVLLAFWADRLLARRATAESGGWRRWAAIAPVAAAGLLCVVTLIVPFRLEESFGSTATGAALGAAMRPWIVLQLAVAVAAGVVVVAGRRLGRRVPAALVAVVVADILLFTVSTSTGLVPGHTTLEPGPALARSVLGTKGRFAIDDTTASNIATLSTIGQPDLNVFTGLDSVQGYGSIIDNSYGTATGTHDLDTLDACALEDGTFVPLRLSSLLTLSQFLAPTAGPNNQAPPPCPGAAAPVVDGRRTFYLGATLTVAGAELAAAPGARGSPRLGLLAADGTTSWPAERVTAAPSGWTVRLRAPAAAVGVVVQGDAASVTDQSSVLSTSGTRYVLDGYLQDAVDAHGWHYAGTFDDYSVFRHAVAPSPVWLAAARPGASVHLVDDEPDGTEIDRVSAPAAVTVVRSEAFEEGWHVVATGPGGATRNLAVTRDGLIQSVRVPAGTWNLTFLYRPTGLNDGLAASTAGLVALVVAGGWAWRRRRAGPAPAPGGGDQGPN